MVREWYETVREDRIRDHFKRSTEDVTPPPSFDQRNSGYYERNSNRIVNDSSDQYIRRQNSYHPGDLRNNRQRDRIYRNGPSYPSIVERSTPVSHHRVPSWYDTSPNAGNGSGGNGGGSSTVSGSGASPVGGRSVYGNVASAVVQPDTSGFDCQLLKKKKSRSGSESPCDRIDRLNDRLIDRNDRGGDRIERLNSGGSSSCADREQRNNGSGRDCGSAASSRSHSRSPSSCSSTNSTSSNNSHVSSPVSGSDPPQSSSSSSHRTQISSSSSSSTTRHHIQSAVSAPSQSGMICNINNHNSSNLISTGVNNNNNNNNNNNSNNNNISINNNNSNNNNNINNNNSNINNNNNNSNNNNNNILVNSTNIASVATTTTSSNIINNNNTNNSNLNNNNNSSSSSGNPVVHSEDNRPLAICVRNLPARSSDTSLKDGLFHEYKKHGKVTWVKVVGQNSERYALVCFKKPEDVEKALEVSHDKLFFGCKIEVAPYQGYDVEDNEFRPYEAELDEYHPKSTRTLFIGNLEKDITSSELRKHFECFGEIIEIDIKKQGMNAYAFCQYSDIVSVVKAMRKMDGEHLGSNRIKLGFGKSMPTSCVWIDGIADSVSENHLTGQFSRYGPVTQVCIDRERKLALVSFDQIQYAQTAVKEMRGATLRGRKLQVDFASRECQEAFYDKIDKQNNSTGGNSNSTRSFNQRYETSQTSQSRSRASSFSGRHNLNNSSGAVSPSNTPGSVGSGCSATGGTTPRGSRSSRSIRHGGSGEFDFPTSSTTTTATEMGNSSSSSRRFRSYDEYSQGSGASHDDDALIPNSYYSSGGINVSGKDHQRSDSPQSRLGPIVGGVITSSSVVDTLEINSTNSGRRRCDKSPGDIRNLQKERFHLLEQLEECPSSGDELVSPKKRMKFDHSSHHHNHHHTLSNYQQSNPIDCSNSSNSMQQPTNIAIGESNCDVLGNHSNDLALLSTSSNSLNLHNHRKCVEVRRLSECNSLKYGNQMLNCNNSSNSNINSSSNNSRRPSIESGALSSCNPNSSSNSSINSIRQTTLLPPQQQQQQQISGNDHPTNNNNNSVFMQTHQSCKRRRMGSSIQIPTGSNNTNNSNNGSMSLLQPSSSTSIGSTSGGSINISIGQDVNEYHSSRGRGHQLHSHHSHEASGGESADGSRPGTPLCDERPEVAPSEPRRIPRDRPHEPMMLPIPKWGIQFVQQHKSIATPAALSSHAGQYYTSLNSSSLSSVNPSNNNLKIFNSSSSALLNSNSNHSSLLNSLSSPPLLAGTRLHPISSVNASSSSTHSQQQLQQQSHNQSSSITISSSSSSSAPHHHHHHHGQHGHHSGTNQTSSASSVSQQHHRHHHSQNQLHIGTERENSPLNKQSSGAATSPLRARSLSSNSSDSDTVTLETGPSMEERIKALDEMFEKWSGNSSVNSSLINRPHTLSSNDLTQNSNITPANYSAINTPSLTSSFLSRHKFLDLDVNEMKPSEIAKSVLGKKSIFDDDYQRLKNINDKYEPGDFSNIVKTPPAIPNLAATKTPVVGCSSLLGTTNKPPTPVSTVFSAPSNLQRLNSSPMNSPQASVSPYNSPSPSPNIALCSTKPTSIIQPQPAKGLQYPFPSHPPSSLVPALSTGNSNATCNSNISSGNATEAQNIPTKLTENKSKTVPILKSYSVPNDKHLVSSQNSSSSSNCSVSPSTTSVAPTPSRTLTKSISVPGSTNSGTVKVSNISSFSTSSALPSNNANKIDEMETDSIKSSTAQLLCQSQLKTSNSSKKTEKLHKQNSKSDSDNKKINSRTEKSIEKSKSEEFDIDTEIDRERQKKEQEEREKLEYERLQQEQIEKEKQQRLEKEKQERERREREVQKKREKEEKEERERKEREEKERKEREEEERKEREEKERREREQKERKEQEEKEKREREEKERREKEEQENREREEQERIEREEKERKIREEKERKEREEKERREREIKEREDYEKREMERKECEERLRREHEEKLRVEREERERKEYETKQQEEKERREREENDRQEREEHERKKLEEFEQRKQNETDYHRKEDHEHRPKTHLSESDTQIKHFEEDNIEKGKSVGNLCRNNSLQINDNENNSEEIQNHPNKENSEIYMQDDLILHKRRDRSKSGNSPIRNTKRRLSSQESIIDLEEHHKRIRIASSGENRKILDRRDSKEPNCKISKHSNLTVKTQQHNRSSSLSSKNCEEKMNYSVDERYRKDSGFDERKHSKEKIKYHFSPISGSLIKQKKQESYNSDIEKDIEINSSDRNNVFSSQDLRSTDEEDLLQHAQHHHTSRPHKSKKKEKRHDHDMEDNSLRQLPEHTTAGRNSESSNQKKHDKYQQDRKQQSSRSEECSNSGSRQHHSSEKPRGKLLSGSRKPPLSSDETNSDEPKKHSIFDIPDDGPYVSMYDKVKARSCKNMQKQEEEKKIKAKFSQLKQCRAKREEKKRSTSYDGDSDSDFDIGEHRSGKYRSKSSRNASGFISSSDDSSLRPQREGIISDSDSDHRLRRMQYNRARLNNLCDDDDTSTDDIQNPNRQHSSNSSAKKITVKRNSRGTRITSETSDSELDKKDQIIVDQDKIKISTNNDDEISFKTEIKKEIDIDDDDKTQSSSGNLQEHYSVKSEKVKSEGHIKLEIKRELYNPYHECISESDNNMSSIPSQAENKDSIFNQLFSPEGRKKHKKNKKRQKTPIPTNNSILMEVQKFEDSADNKGNMSSSMEHVFDELKREHLLEKQQHQTPHIVSHVSIHSSSQHSEKKKHKDRKEKKREKYHRNDEIDKSGLSKEERHRLKKSKKASKAAAAASQAISTTTESPNIRNYTNYDASVITAASKRSGEMVENLFGPLSDEESQLSPTDTAVQKDLTVKNITPNNINSNLEDQTQNICIFKQEPLTPKSHTVEENEENKLKISSIERERHRKEKREKKRKEREKSREQHALSALQNKFSAEDDNSVDLDEAGRVLEAQLLADSITAEDQTPSTATTHKSDMTDVFRFSDHDENSMEIVSMTEKKESEHHKNKDKKKKKKKSKEDRHHPKREHHHHNSNNVIMMSPPPSTNSNNNKLSILISTPNAEHRKSPICKPSPSLPCLTDDDGPIANLNDTPILSSNDDKKINDLELSVSPISQEKVVEIQKPKTPTIPEPSSVKSIEIKKKPEKFIPGFDGELDEKISESAVQSISAEFTSPVIDPVPEEPKIPIASPPGSNKITDKEEEKSRVVISQEETEDAVAALLGESFGNSSTADYSFIDDPIDVPSEEVDASTEAIATTIPEEDAEEMRKAVQSLSTAEDIDIKPDTPQSENDLQIDTDTEEQDDDNSNQFKFENCPKTPDVDLSQITKISDESSKTTEKAITSISIDEKAIDKDDGVNKKHEEEICKEPVVIKSKEIQKTDNKKDEKQDPKEKIPEVNLNEQIQNNNCSNNPVTIRKPVVQTIIPQQQSKIERSSPTIPSSPTVSSSKTNLVGSPITQTRPQFPLQPPTISIPEPTHFTYPQTINVARPSTPTGDVRLQSPRQISPQAMSISQQQHISAPNAAYTVNLRMQSPHSPNIIRGQNSPIRIQNPQQNNGSNGQHVLIQQRQILSPPNANVSLSNPNIVMNRMPVTTVLSTIPKALQPTSIILPQSTSAQTSISNIVSSSSSANTPEPKQEIKMPTGQTLTYQSTRVNIQTQPVTISQHKIGNQNQNQLNIKSVIENSTSQQLPQGINQQPQSSQASQHIQHIIAQQKTQQHQTIILQQPAAAKQIQQQNSQRISPQQIQQIKIVQQHQQQHAIQQQRQQMQHMQQKQQLHQQQHQLQQQQQQQQQQQHQSNFIQKIQQSAIQKQQQHLSSQSPNPYQSAQRALHHQPSPILQVHQFPQSSQPTIITPQPTIIQTISSQNKDNVSPNNIQMGTSRLQQNVVIVRQSPTQNIIQQQPAQSTLQQQKVILQPNSQSHQQQQNIQKPQHIAIVQPQQHQMQMKQVQQPYQQHVSTQPVQIKLANKPNVTENIQFQQQSRKQIQLQSVHISSVQQAPGSQGSPQKIPTPTTEKIISVETEPSNAPAKANIVQKPSSNVFEKTTSVDIVQEPVKSPENELNQDKIEEANNTMTEKSKNIEVEKNEVVAIKTIKEPEPPAEKQIIIPNVEKNEIMEETCSKDQDTKPDLKNTEPTPESESKIIKESENISVIKLSTSPPVTTQLTKEKSLLTEENVNKLSAPEEDQIEQDSKEDSDYWSAKEINIDSVIKKVDALCDETVKINEEKDKLDVKPITSSDQNPNQSVTTDIKSTELLEKDNEDTAEEEKEKISITLEKNEDTHDEDEIDTEAIVESNSNKQISKVPKRSSTRGNRGGKKMPPVNVAQTESTSSTSTLNEGVKTRRGSATVITPSTRGRKGRPSTKSVVTAINEKKTTKSNISQNVTDQDVYEFHDDSGEETTSKIPPVSERPRLILTIKSPGQTPSATITTSSTTSSNQSNIPQSQPSVTTHSNVQSKAAEKQDDLENVSSPLGPPPPPPSPASCGTQQESKDGQHSNTRKSRRLQEKDRSTVDDIIEDVVRNSAPSPKGNQTPPRRSTRNQQQTPSLVNEKLQQQQSQQQSQHLSAIIDNKTKSPRPNRRTKDRKSSDASIGSSDEKDSINKSSDEKVPDDSVNKSIEQIDESKKAATINPSTPTVNSEYDKVDKKKAAAQANTNTANINISPQESLSLIDPVTGVLTVVRQNQEGQYVTVCGKPKQIYTSIEIEKMQKQQTLVTTEKVKSENKELNKTDKAPQQVKVSTPEVNVSIPSTATPHKATSVVVSTPQQQQQLQSVTSSLPTQPATVVVTQSQNQSQLQPQAQSIVIQPQLPQQQNIRTHPLKAHVLNSQKHLQQQQQEHQHQQHHQSQIQKQQQILQNAQSPSHQIQSQSQMIKMNQTQQQIAGSTSVSSSILVSNPNHVIQQNVVVAKHISNPNEMQHSPKLIQSSTQHQTLIVNAPQSASNSPHQAQMLSPHLQQVHQQQQHSSQQQQQHSVPLQVQQQVITNNHPGQPVVHVLAKQQGNIQHPPVVIHSTKQQINHQIGGQHQNHPAYVGPTIVQGGKVIQSTQNNQNTSQQQPATVAIQTAGNKHQTIHVPIPPVHISHQKQPSQSGGVSVVTSHTLSKSQQSGQQIHVQSQIVGQIPQQVGQQQHLSAAQKMNQQILQQLGALGPNASPAIIQQHITRSGIEIIPSPGPINQSSSQGQHIYATHPNPTQQQIANASLMQQTKTVLQQSQQGPQQQMPSQVQQQQISGPPKGAISIHQGQQIMTGAVASPPPIKQQHISTGQQPLVTGAGTLRVSVPTISPQGQARAHMIQPGMPVSAFEANLHDIGNYNTSRSKSPPPAHQQASPITPGEGTFPPNQMRGAVPKEHYIIYQQYLLDQARKPYISRSPLIPGLTDQKELSEMEETMAASPPLELRRPGSGPRSIAIPHGLQSPQDRTSDSPQAAQVYVHTRIPHPHFPDGGPRYFENVRQLPTEPPPAHRPTHTIVPPPSGPSPHNYGPHPLPPSPSQLAPVPTGPGTLVHIHPKAIEREREREREQREREQREKERISIPGGHTSMPSHGSLVPAMPTPGGRNCQVATPPHASQVPQQADSLLTLLQRYPVMWQGILALKTDQAAVQMHFVFGNPLVARGSLPCNSDGSTPPLRIAQRMRLEQVQLEGVTKKMQYENEHCMLLALPCGRDHMDVLQQSRNLQTGFITYLQQKMAAGIVNIPLPGSEQPAYVVHIFPSCDFANENLERAAPDLKHRVAEIAHLLIVIATV